LFQLAGLGLGSEVFDEKVEPMKTKRNHLFELLLVLGVSLGASAIWSILSLIRKLLAPEGLAGTTTAINRPLATQEYLDLAYQLANILLPLVPALLALYFLAQDLKLGEIGLAPKKKDLLHGIVLAAAIGVPGIGLYFVALWLGLSSQIQPNSLNGYWWTIPVLILAAAKASILEEIIVVAFLTEKLKFTGATFLSIVLVSALIRGSYHLYQGFGGFVGNMVMGIVFAIYYQKTRRVAPLLVAHFVMDATVFVFAPLVLG
jgi:membrane protease YdiL (CAAX protease family)